MASLTCRIRRAYAGTIWLCHSVATRAPACRRARGMVSVTAPTGLVIVRTFDPWR
jgi:hypothetical protein